ncbi:MAG: hypothetical protein QNJ72_42845 [Pleurocapsa sp. MO_226.B13]|nr:hypothetical protein [Pleurocapsa sp. MO_226.B13]
MLFLKYTKVWFGSSLVIRQQLTIGQLLAFNSMNNNFLTFVVAAVSFVDRFTLPQAAGERYGETLEMIPENINDGTKPWTKISSTCDLICDRLNFNYPARSK